MNILSLFDGISLALLSSLRAGIKPDLYFASEVDKYAITISQKNWNNGRIGVTQLGDVRQINNSLLLPNIDLLIGGSPCQGFSKAGTGLNFAHKESALFFEYVRIKELVKPKYFLLENVVMKKEWQDVITSILGVEPIEINASLVSAQHRRRLFWTNIPGVTQPKDKGIHLI